MKPFSWKELLSPELPPWEVAFRAMLTYVFIHIVFRLMGRREWTRYSAFNVAVLFLIAVALRTTMVGNDSSLTSGAVAFVTIMAMDWIFSYLSYRNRRLGDWISGPVRPLIRDGRLLPAEMRRARISEDDLRAQVRMRGRERLDEVEEAMLERSGQVSIRWKHDPDRGVR